MSEDNNKPVYNQKQYEADMALLETVNNVMTSRSQFINQFLDPRRNIDKECGYPETGSITPQLYRKLYDRESIATRVVQVMPQESWQHTPEVYEDEDTETETPFERAWDELAQSLRGDSHYKNEEGSPIWEHLKRADMLSGIGHFGCLLMGFNDGKQLWEPIDKVPPDGYAKDITGVDTSGSEDKDSLTAKKTQSVAYGSVTGAVGTDAQYTGGQYNPANPMAPMQGDKNSKLTLIFLRSFDESLVQIVQYEADISNPRFGQPIMYMITLNDPREQHTGVGLPLATVRVHWSRVIHVADNLGSSEIFGVPRMRPVFNRLLDLMKLYGGSAEMYWRGAFPGLSIETHPQLGGDVIIDAEKTRSMMERYENTLQRYIQLSGMTAKSLAPQVVDPTPQITIQIEAICILIGIPKQIFIGAGSSGIGSGMETESLGELWNERVNERQNNYLTPRIIVPFVDRLILIGVLPIPNSSKDEENDEAAPEDASEEAETEEIDGEETTTNAFAPNKKSGKDVQFPPKSTALSSGKNEGKDAGIKKVKQGYCVKWPDPNTQSKAELATTALARTQAMSAYVTGQVESLIDPQDYLSRELGYSEEEAKAILENTTKHLEDSHPDTDEEIMPGHVPQPPEPELPPNSPIKMGQGETLFDSDKREVLHKTPAPKVPVKNELTDNSGDDLDNWVIDGKKVSKQEYRDFITGKGPFWEGKKLTDNGGPGSGPRPGWKSGHGKHNVKLPKNKDKLDRHDAMNAVNQMGFNVDKTEMVNGERVYTISNKTGEKQQFNDAELKELAYSKPSISHDDLIKGMKTIEPAAERGAMVGARELRAHFGDKVSKEEFDTHLMSLAKEGKVGLSHHDYVSSLSQKQRDELVSYPVEKGTPMSFDGRKYAIGISMFPTTNAEDDAFVTEFSEVVDNGGPGSGPRPGGGSKRKEHTFGMVLSPSDAKGAVEEIRAGDVFSKNKGNVTAEPDVGELVVSRFPLKDLGQDQVELLRSSTNAERVAHYVNQPITTPVYLGVSKRKGNVFVNDGGHRILAAIDRGDKEINALVPRALHEKYFPTTNAEEGEDAFSL